MANQVKIWFVPQTDFLEVLFSEKAGFMRESEYDIIMERVDEEGNILGFLVMPFSMINDDQSALFYLNTLWLKAGNSQNDFEKLLAEKIINKCLSPVIV